MSAVPFDLANIPNALQAKFGLPHLDGEVVSSWITKHVAAAKQEEAWRPVVRQWLERLAATLGPPYRVMESELVVLLTALPERPAALLLASTTRSCARTAQLLGHDTAPWVALLALATTDTYYDYVAPFFDDGHSAASVGVCLNGELVHVALGPAELMDLEETAAHELAHANASAYPLPLWLDEGIAEIATEPFGRTLLDADELQDMQECWRRHGLETFWTGEAFAKPDERSTAAYDLAYTLTRGLATRNQEAFAGLIQSATWEDAGRAACKEAFGIDVEALARSIAGVGAGL